MMKNADPKAPWNLKKFSSDPAAPHNKDPDNPVKPWNKRFWFPEELSREERKYYGIDFEFYNYKQLQKWKR